MVLLQAIRAVSRGEDPSALMIGTILTTALSVLIGAPLTAFIVIRAVNGGDICLLFYCF